MTIKELKKIKRPLQYSLEIDSDCCLLEEDKQAIIEALEKQIPKKPVSFKRTAHDFQSDTCKYSGCYCEHIMPFNHEYQYTDYKCPACGKLLSDGTPGYCWNCGQALDWRDER